MECSTPLKLLINEMFNTIKAAISQTPETNPTQPLTSQVRGILLLPRQQRAPNRPLFGLPKVPRKAHPKGFLRENILTPEIVCGQLNTQHFQELHLITQYKAIDWQHNSRQTELIFFQFHVFHYGLWIKCYFMLLAITIHPTNVVHPTNTIHPTNAVHPINVIYLINVIHPSNTINPTNVIHKTKAVHPTNIVHPTGANHPIHRPRWWDFPHLEVAKKSMLMGFSKLGVNSPLMGFFHKKDYVRILRWWDFSYSEV